MLEYWTEYGECMICGESCRGVELWRESDDVSFMIGEDCLKDILHEVK